ncbi:MAG: nuclear transport factor 2 family protein [Pseudomonadota bacterium]
MAPTDSSDPSDDHRRLSHEIESAERAVWTALLQGDSQADLAALAPDFLGVYPDGFADRAAHADQLADGATIASYALDDIQIRGLGPDHALIVYRATYLRPASDTAEMMYVSSIWQRHPDGWRNIFSQDTPADPTRSVP